MLADMKTVREHFGSQVPALHTTLGQLEFTGRRFHIEPTYFPLNSANWLSTVVFICGKRDKACDSNSLIALTALQTASFVSILTNFMRSFCNSRYVTY